MFEFIKTKIYDSLLISSVVTVLEVDLRKKESVGEVHNFPEIIYIKDGYTDLLLEGTIVQLKKGQLIIIAPNTFHGKTDFIGLIICHSVKKCNIEYIENSFLNKRFWKFVVIVQIIHQG